LFKPPKIFSNNEIFKKYKENEEKDIVISKKKKGNLPPIPRKVNSSSLISKFAHVNDEPKLERKNSVLNLISSKINTFISKKDS
jgi:hypothetical protein